MRRWRRLSACEHWLTTPRQCNTEYNSADPGYTLGKHPGTMRGFHTGWGASDFFDTSIKILTCRQDAQWRAYEACQLCCRCFANNSAMVCEIKMPTLMPTSEHHANTMGTQNANNSCNNMNKKKQKTVITVTFGKSTGAHLLNCLQNFQNWFLLGQNLQGELPHVNLQSSPPPLAIHFFHLVTMSAKICS